MLQTPIPIILIPNRATEADIADAWRMPACRTTNNLSLKWPDQLDEFVRKREGRKLRAVTMKIWRMRNGTVKALMTMIMRALD